MADLMTGTNTYDQLAQKYKNFLVPAVKLKCQGKDLISSLKLAVENVSISLSLDFASSCHFTVANAYDLKARTFDSQIKSQLMLGTVLEVEIGYGSATTLVFKGYVSELTYEFRDLPVLEVTVLDVRRLMMEGQARMLVHSVQNYSQAFSDVMQRYQKICSNLVIDKTDDKLKSVTQTTSDYDFVARELARKADREFFVLAGKAYFRLPQKSTSPILTLEWGKGLLSFSRNAMYHDAAIKVVGFDEENKKALVGEATSKGDDPQKSVISQPQPTVYTEPDAVETGQVKNRAETEGKKRKRKTQGGRGLCIGLPEIVPGRFIELKKLDSDLDGKYYIKNVDHNLGADGFSTSFSVGGWK
jgi:phage protein D